MLRSNFRALTLAATLAPLFTAAGTQAAEFVVISGSNEGDSNPGDGICRTPGAFGACSLRAAVEESNALPGTDTIVIGAGTHAVHSPQRVLEDHVDIEGAGADQTTLYSAGGNFRLFEVTAGTSVQVSDMTLEGFHVSATPDSYGAAINNEGNLIVLNVWFRDSFAARGCAALRNSGLVEIYDSTFSANRAGVDYGAGAFCVVDGGSAVAYNTTFAGNRGYRGGAVEVLGTSSFLALYASTFYGNVSVVGPGTPTASAIYLEDALLDLELTLVAGDCHSVNGTVASGGANLESPGDTCELDGRDDQIAVPEATLGVGPLGRFGGSVPTVLLGSTSPAVDPPVQPVGCPIEDARGFLRDGTCDTGAFERQPDDAVLIFADGFESGDIGGWGLQ